MPKRLQVGEDSGRVAMTWTKLEDHFTIERPESGQLDLDTKEPVLELTVTCNNCGRAWGILPNMSGEIDKGSRNSLLGHAKAHYERARMRRL